jgi:hypothetical protein
MDRDRASRHRTARSGPGWRRLLTQDPIGNVCSKAARLHSVMMRCVFPESGLLSRKFRTQELVRFARLVSGSAAAASKLDGDGAVGDSPDSRPGPRRGCAGCDRCVGGVLGPDDEPEASPFVFTLHRVHRDEDVDGGRLVRRVDDQRVPHPVERHGEAERRGDGEARELRQRAIETDAVGRAGAKQRRQGPRGHDQHEDRAGGAAGDVHGLGEKRSA